MQKALLFAGLTALSLYSSAQNTFPSTGSVGIGTTAPGASSILEIRSTTKGLLIPRMTMAQRNAIPSPATGLLIFQTDGTPGFYYYRSGWQALGGATSGGANTALSNLAAATSVNSHLLPA
ncbi:MAG TPA: hypothetical protein VHK69_02330, partial [Chitinophagaceae bacterium]|nr:hypothetical protein [Chitinophagaceae bacterium]